MHFYGSFHSADFGAKRDACQAVERHKERPTIPKANDLTEGVVSNFAKPTDNGTWNFCFGESPYNFYDTPTYLFQASFSYRIPKTLKVNHF